jgi:DinB family protein
MTDSPLADTLKRCLRQTVRMMTNAIESCPDAAWDRPGPAGAAPAWKQIYHALYWYHEWLRDWGTPLDLPPYHPPEALSLDEGGRVLTRHELLDFASRVTRTSDALLANVRTDADLLVEGTQWRKPWTMAERILAEIRHVQHHVGYLNATLRAAGAPAVEWISYKDLN